MTDSAMRGAALAWHVAGTLAGPVLRLTLRRRAARGREIPGRLPERRGIDATPRPPGTLIWVHAASVGEAVSVLPVLAALPEAVSVLLTTGTVTSAALLARRLPELGLAGRVRHRFVPLDVPRWAARFLDHWRPDAAAFLESELWPNLLLACRRRGVPLALLNARLSARSQARWRRFPGLARVVLGAFDRIEAQSPEDARRLAELAGGAVGMPGNLKFAAPSLPADPAELARLRALLGDRPVWLAASTHPGEEAIAAEVHVTLAPRWPGLLTVIVPRHPERGAALAAELAGAGAGPVPRRAAGEDPPAASGLWLADTLGELGLFYRLAPLAFIGGSLAPRGGQNPLEAARLGCAVAVGPGVENFAGPVAALTEARALAMVPDGAALARWVEGMLRDPQACRRAGENGARIATQAADLPARIAALLMDMLTRSPTGDHTGGRSGDRRPGAAQGAGMGAPMSASLGDRSPG